MEDIYSEIIKPLRSSGAPATGVKGKETQAGGTQIGTRRSAGGPRSPRRRQARRPTSRAVWRAGDAAMTRCGRAVSLGGPQPEVSQDLPFVDDRGLLDTRDDPHGSGALGTHERIHLVHLRDQASASSAERRAHG